MDRDSSFSFVVNHLRFFFLPFLTSQKCPGLAWLASPVSTLTPHRVRNFDNNHAHMRSEVGLMKFVVERDNNWIVDMMETAKYKNGYCSRFIFFHPFILIASVTWTSYQLHKRVDPPRLRNGSKFPRFQQPKSASPVQSSPVQPHLVLSDSAHA